MRIADFALERFFARWEFAVRHLLCASDVEGWRDGRSPRPRRRRDRGALGATCGSATRRRPAIRSSAPRSPSLYDTIEPDDVLVFAGAEEAIFCLSNVLLGPGDHAVVTWPGYQSLYEVGRAAGADVTLHVLHEADGWALDAGAADRGRSARRPGSSSSTRRTTRRACCRRTPSGHA